MLAFGGMYVGFLFLAFWTMGVSQDWMRSWTEKSSGWFESVLAVLAIGSMTASVLTLITVLLGWVRMTRPAIATVFGFFLSLYMPLFVASRIHWWIPQFVFLGLVPMFAMLEVMSVVKPWKKESWNNRSFRERWASSRTIGG
jgi:hypothetical protein